MFACAVRTATDVRLDTASPSGRSGQGLPTSFGGIAGQCCGTRFLDPSRCNPSRLGKYRDRPEVSVLHPEFYDPPLALLL